MRNRKASVFAIFLTVFLDLLAFGLAISDIQLRGEKLGAFGLTMGLLLAVYSIAQFVTAPFLGRLSDRVGRRKVLLVTTFFMLASFVVYAHVESLALMFLARVIQGMAGGSVGVAYAYIADITKPEERAKSMGLIGAAFGLGFLFGVPGGAFLVKAANGHPILMGYTAAALALVNFIYIWFFLPESLDLSAPKEASAKQESTVAAMRRAFATPALGLLLMMFFAANFGFANLESTYFRLVSHQFNMKQDEGAIVLTVVGIVSALMQGFLIRKLQPRFGEVKLLRAGFLIQVPVLALVPFTPPWVPMLLGATMLSIGSALVQPTISSLISRNTPKELQGSIFGVNQALGAMARILAPVIGNTLFEVRAWLPYALAAGIVAIPMVLAWRVRMPENEGDPDQPVPMAH
jgi:MFS transporter, DHA1 family, tetracycline resistance protein